MQTARRGNRGWVVGGGWLAATAALVLVAVAPAPAQDVSRAAPSLKLVPADALYYGVSLRNREQLEAIVNSKAWKKLMDLPAVQMARQGIEQVWAFPIGPAGEIKAWIERPENEQLFYLLGDMFSDEVFSFGGKHTAEFFALLGELQLANQLAPLKALVEGRDPGNQDPTYGIRAMLHTLQANAERLRAPDIVIGFRVRDTEAAQAQLKRLDLTVQGLIRLNPRFEGYWSKAKMAGGEFYTLKLEGGMVPWEKIPWERVEEQEGEFDDLKKKLRDVKMTINIGLRDKFLIVAIAETPRLLESLDKGPRLASRPEFKPLAKYADRPLTNISFESKEWRKLQTGDKEDVQEMFGRALDFLKDSDLSDEQKAKISKDLKALSKDLQKFMVEPGPSLSFQFLTKRGSESYAYDWTREHGYVADKPLTILRHAGASPLLVLADRTHQDPETYKVLVKWTKVAWEYVEEYLISRLDEEKKAKYDAFMKDARPILVRLNHTTIAKLFPALADGQGALVLDARLTSQQWHRDMPQAQKPLPLLEPAIVLGVSDAKLLKEALADYRLRINELITLAAKFSPEGQAPGEIPPPQTKKIEGATLYFYPLPEQAGLDRQVAPAMAIAKSVAVLALSPDHARRLLEAQPLRTQSKLLADSDRPLAAAAYVNCEGFWNVLGEWADYGITTAGVQQAGPFDVRDHVQTLLDVLKVFRSYSSVTYTEGGALVTHAESVIRDLE